MRLGLLLMFAAASVSAQTTFDPPVVGSPYSIVRHWEQHNVMPDGKAVESRSVMKIYRDSAGRVRTDMQIDDQYMVKTVIIDRANRVEYWWNNKSKLCTMMKLGEPNGPPAHNVIPEGDSRTRNTGTGAQRYKDVFTGTAPKTIEGLKTTGTHVDRYAPDGKTIVFTSDAWYQMDLRLSLFTEITDALEGHSVYRFTDLKRDEPPADLFVAPPKGYTVRVYESPNEGKFE